MGRRTEAFLLPICRDRGSRLAVDALHLCRLHPPHLSRLLHHQVDALILLHPRGSTENMSMVQLVIIVAAVLFYILLTTTLSNPGIAFRDQPVDPSVQTVSTCRRISTAFMKRRYL